MGNFKKQEFMSWCTKNNVTQFEAFSIAFVDESTAKNVLYDIRPVLAAQFRLWKLTGLDCFKLSNDEMNVYSLEKKRKLFIVQDEQIMQYFLDQWTTDKKTPSEKDSLSLRSEVKQNKKELRITLMKKFFDNSVAVGEPKNTKSEVGTHVAVKASDNPKNEVASNTENKSEVEPIIFKLFNTTVHNKVHLSGKDELIVFKKQNFPAIKDALGLLNILMEEDPFAAAKEVREFKKHF